MLGFIATGPDRPSTARLRAMARQFLRAVGEYAEISDEVLELVESIHKLDARDRRRFDLALASLPG